ncbi:MAG: hypothetical protein KDC38_10570 [Planctomycetes bacterium]|nr:hypothetical protein [Planctomycetota bacterium]
MIDVTEKVLWVLALLLLLALGGVYFLLGTKSAIPAIAMHGRNTSKDEVTKILGAEQVKSLDAALRANPREGDTDKQYERTAEKYRVVNRATFDRFSNLNDAFQEVKKYSSSVVDNDDGSNSLEIFDLGEASTLTNLGFEDHDIIDYIDGEKIDFSNPIEGRQLFQALRDRMEQQGYLKIDIRRRSKPTKVIVTLDKLPPM